MKDKIYLIITIVLVIILIIASAFFVLHANKLNNQINQNKAIIQKMESELVNTREEKEGIAKTNEKLQADSVSYLSINTKLNDEKEELDKKLRGAQKIIDNKEANLQRVQSRLEEIEKRASAARKIQDEKLAREKKALEKKVIKTAAAIKKERGVYHYNLGVAYAQAKLYDEAITEYEKSLEFDPDNADACYNLGMLYEAAESDLEKAVINYKKYLELNPTAEDTDEVHSRIKKLGG